MTAEKLDFNVVVVKVGALWLESRKPDNGTKLQLILNQEINEQINKLQFRFYTQKQLPKKSAMKYWHRTPSNRDKEL